MVIILLGSSQPLVLPVSSLPRVSLPSLSSQDHLSCYLLCSFVRAGLIVEYDAEAPNCFGLLFGSLTLIVVWRIITNFFFLGKFSINFGIRLLMIARYGVQTEKGPFNNRTADFLWMMLFGAFTLLVMSAIPLLWSPFLGISLVFMLLYVWSREFPDAQVNIYGLVNMKAFYLPWAMLALDVIFGSPLLPDFMGIVAGHLYYFLSVLYPLSGGRNFLKTPRWVHKLVAYWGVGFQANAPVRRDNNAAGVAFRGRSYRLN